MSLSTEVEIPLIIRATELIRKNFPNLTIIGSNDSRTHMGERWGETIKSSYSFLDLFRPDEPDNTLMWILAKMLNLREKIAWIDFRYGKTRLYINGRANLEAVEPIVLTLRENDLEIETILDVE